MIYLTEKDRN